MVAEQACKVLLWKGIDRGVVLWINNQFCLNCLLQAVVELACMVFVSRRIVKKLALGVICHLFACDLVQVGAAG